MLNIPTQSFPAPSSQQRVSQSGRNKVKSTINGRIMSLCLCSPLRIWRFTPCMCLKEVLTPYCVLWCPRSRSLPCFMTVWRTGGPQARPQSDGLDPLFKKWQRLDWIKGPSDRSHSARASETQQERRLLDVHPRWAPAGVCRWVLHVSLMTLHPPFSPECSGTCYWTYLQYFVMDSQKLF